jgi:DNA-binding MarR family transcriptional regulator
MNSEPSTSAAVEVPWLTPREYDAWRGFLDATRAVFQALEQQLQAEAGMPLAYYDILVRLSEAPDRSLRMVTLAKALDYSTSRLSHAVDRLERCGWVRRASHPSDRRGQLAVLTDAGFSALEAAAPGHVAAVRAHVIEPLTPDQLDQLAVISRTLSAAAGASPTAPAAAPSARDRLASPTADRRRAGSGGEARRRPDR